MTGTKDVEKAITTILDAVTGNLAPTFSERDLVRLVIAFANTGRPTGLPGSRVMSVGGQTFTVITNELPPQHVELQRDLSAIVAGELSGPAAARLRKHAGCQVLVPVFELRRGVTLTRYRHLTSDLAATVSYVLLRVHSDVGLRDDVKRCRLAGCGRFFLASDDVKDPTAPGRRRHRYCTPEHMTEAQTSGAERTRRYRERLLSAARRK